jgi:lipopolysaccharide transport system ATP-binding protein
MSKAIQVEGVSKQYRLGQIGTGSLVHDVNRWWHQVRGKEDPYLKIGEANDRSTKGSSQYVWSLRDISFDIEQGDSVGIIGRNGAGKSTLLKILSRVTAPTTGNLKVKGRIASLLEVGTGFHPDLSGRDNIYLNGAILGMRKHEITRKFDEIVDFAGVERYIDTPVKRYSSGMYVRLAFAVAAYLESEILIVDEVLAVGDAEFQKKCLGKMNDVSKGEGRTVLFVSHQLGTVAQLCNTSILLSQGCILKKGVTGSIIEYYLKNDSERTHYVASTNETEKKDAWIIYQKVVDASGNLIESVSNNDSIILETRIRIMNWQSGIELSVCLQHPMKGIVFTLLLPVKKYMKAGEKEKTIRIIVQPNTLTPNNYSWQTALHIPGSHILDQLMEECPFSVQDTGTEFARYEGQDCGVFFLKDYQLEIF